LRLLFDSDSMSLPNAVENSLMNDQTSVGMS